MAVGDGSAWDETNPTNSTIATSIDDYDRDLRLGVRSRMAHEHEWPSSQSATNQGGQHKFVTLQNQAVKPTVSGTQLGAVYTKTSGSGLQELYWENEAGTEVQITYRSSVGTTSGFSNQLIRVWGVLDGTASGTSSALSGIGVATTGVVRVSTGVYTVTFSASYVNATNYSFIAIPMTTGLTDIQVMQSSALVTIYAKVPSTDQPCDPLKISYISIGSQ